MKEIKDMTPEEKQQEAIRIVETLHNHAGYAGMLREHEHLTKMMVEVNETTERRISHQWRNVLNSLDGCMALVAGYRRAQITREGSWGGPQWWCYIEQIGGEEVYGIGRTAAEAIITTWLKLVRPEFLRRTEEMPVQTRSNCTPRGTRRVSKRKGLRVRADGTVYHEE